MSTPRFDIPLLPFIDRLKDHEAKRAARARKVKSQKVRNISVHYPSVNTLYPCSKGTGTKRLSDEGRIYKDYIDEVLTAQFDRLPDIDLYDVSYIFYMTHDMMFFKNGELRNTDVSNYLKATEDALFEWLLESDKTVMDIHGYKRVIDAEPKIVILLGSSTETAPIFQRGHMIWPAELYDEDIL